MDTAAKWFVQGFGARVDALEASIASLDEGTEAAGEQIRFMADMLHAPARSYGLPDVANAAQTCAETDDATLIEAARQLIERLRDEIARIPRAASVILIVGGHPDWQSAISQGISAAHRRCVCFAGEADAKAFLRDNRVAMIILHLILSDSDGRAMLVRLRESARTAAVPILAIAPSGETDLAQDGILTQANACLPDAQPIEVIDWARQRLRRAHETVREARRDRLTGLLNRAAFRETFDRLAREAREGEEPLSIVLMEIDRSRELEQLHGKQSMDNMLQRVGSMLSYCARATDSIARWGPFEFAVCYPGEDHFGATRAIEKFMEELAAARFASEESSDFPVTVSTGVVLAETGASFDTTMANADGYVFQAASSGGNRIVSRETPVVESADRVLLIMSDPIAGRVLTHLLAQNGLSVAHAQSAAEGLELARGEERYHLAIVNERVQDTEGIEIVSQLKRVTYFSRVPVVMVLTPGNPERIAKALQAGANDYVTTPLAPLVFVSHVRRLLTRGRTLRATASPLRRILIIDPAVAVLTTTATALHRRGGFAAYLATSADDARERLDEVKPDIVLVDGALAQANPALLQAISDQTAAATLLSGLDPAELAPELQKTVRGHLAKPLAVRTIGAQIERSLNLSQTRGVVTDTAAHLNAEIQRILGTAGNA